MILSPNRESRRGTIVDLLAIHTTEGILDPINLGHYFGRRDIQASSHDGCGSTSTVQYVPYAEAAWTLLNGNLRSENLEIGGFAHWSRDEWLNNHRGRLDQAAAWIARRAVARGIPIRKLTPAQVDAGMSGVIGHSDWTYSAIGWGNHTDPGTGFPWDYVIERARAIANGGPLPSGPAPAPAPKPATAWPLPRGHYFGDITGPEVEHGGITAQEQVWVRQIQQALIRAGVVPGVTNPNSGWADGRWEAPTTTAVQAWQRKVGYRVTGDVHQVDWDLLVIGRASVPPGTPGNPPPSAPPSNGVPPFPLPRGHYFGDVAGPNESHGGYYPSERPWVRLIQQALIRKGYVPGVTDVNSGWADGKFERPTVDAVARFQRREMPGTQFYGQVWADDWARLLA